MIYLGTSGFSYDDWRAHWYPPDLARNRMFDYYAEHFNALEVNSTFYHTPGRGMMESLVKRGDGRVRFSIKLHKSMTHDADSGTGAYLAYERAIAPAAEADQLAAVLVQFPFRLHFDADARERVDQIADRLKAYPLVFEIRHASWQTAEGTAFFRDRGLSLCVVDMPRLKNLPESRIELTGPIAYIRFHGRNSRDWFTSTDSAGPYNYKYTGEEIKEWVEPIKKLEKAAETALVFFNNHIHGQAPQNAEMMLKELGETVDKPGYRDMFS